MKLRPKFWSLVSLLCLVGAWFFWQQGNRWTAERTAAAARATATGTAASGTPAAKIPENSGQPSAASTNRLTYRLTNTPKTISQLEGDRHAILLENAFIDTSAALNLKIPSQLKAAGDPGAYIVQARGPIGAGFRAALAAAGAQIVSYIPNNAYLVRLSAGAANGLAANALVQSVLPYEPYYKVQPSLLGLAVDQKPLPPGTYLTLGLFSDTAATTEAQIKKLGGIILSKDRSPFGQVVRVSPPSDWISLVNLAGVQIVEPAYLRKPANDLARPMVGVATDSTTQTNWLGLTGQNVTVEVNDSGIDAAHPDFSANHTQPSRVFSDLTQFPDALTDTSGHGTHVAGIIAGDGTMSMTVTNASGSIMPATNGQFRGMAPMANLFSLGFLGVNDTNEFVDDSVLQQTPALTNALISNNSWFYGGDNEYDLAAASYDAAVRDALPAVTGPQPVLFVFAAGNDGGGDTEGQEGSADTITSPGTAKDVITVGALEQMRNITNIVTDIYGNSNAVWQAETDSGNQVADYSARGNVGVQTEGASGRFKPDVVAPGTFMISTRSEQWDQPAYYNPTNYHNKSYLNQVVTSNTYMFGGVTIPLNAVGVTIKILPNALSPVPFPTNLFIYASAYGNPNPTNPLTYDLVTSNNLVSVPPDTGGLITDITSLEDYGLAFAVGDSTNIPVNFDVFIQVVTTNDFGNELEVLSNLNNSISGSAPYWYRYESGTSMSTPVVSGVLACMQDYFTNVLKTTPSPALLKAMLINGARPVGNYRYAVTNTLNLQGWGVAQLDNSIPAALTNGLTTLAAGTNGTPMFFVDQSPTNALATGDSQTYEVQVMPGAQSQALRVTLAWTDPPGNPAAAIKLVNNLDVVVTNTATGEVYYANNFTTSGTPPYTLPAATNAPPPLDYVNNVRNIFIPSTLGTNYSVTVIGRSVNVNADTLEQTNVVQDYALVISTGDGNATSGIKVTPAAPLAASVTNVTYIVATNGIYFDQLVGASAPLLSTNGVGLGGTSAIYGANALDQIGQTNQWHFYVVTNTFALTNSAYTNAAFITFIPNTLAIPREGVFAGSDANSTRPEADIDLYVAGTHSDPSAASLLGLDPTVISNCVYGNLGDGASLTRGGTEFVAYNNSAGGDVYYIGVQSQDQTAGQYGFIAVFSDKPFSSQDAQGNEYVNGVPLPANIPDGNNAHPGVSYVFGLALAPIEINRVVVTNVISHQNFGDLVGALSHGGGYAVLNSHDGFGPVVNTNLVYDDSGRGDILGSRTSDGPGSLQTFVKKQAVGPWLLNMVDDSIGNTGSISGFNLFIEKHQDPRKGITATVGPHQWFYTYVDVPVGYYSLSVLATNVTPPPLGPDLANPLQLYLKEGSQPTFTDTNYMAFLTNGTPPAGSVTIGPPLTPDTYYIGIYNPSSRDQTVYLIANLLFDARTIQMVDYPSTDTPLPIVDDALTVSPVAVTNYGWNNSTITVTNQQTIEGFTVGLRVDHPRISDMVFTLIRPDGERYLLMENRGGATTNGCGITLLTTNDIGNVTANGTTNASTNFVAVSQLTGTLPISWNFFTIPDQMTVYDNTNGNYGIANQLFDTGLVSGTGQTNLPYTTTSGLTIIMNQTGNANGSGGDAWTFTAGGVTTNFEYLDFTEDTNLTTTPIKFAVPPFIPAGSFSTNFVLSDFETAAAGNYLATANATIADESIWTVLSNQVSVVNDPVNAAQGSNFLALANGTISNSIPTVPGVRYTLTFAYRGPGIADWWRGESNSVAIDSIGSNNGQLNGVNYTNAIVGNGFSFNGVNSYINVPASPTLQFSNSFTLETWFENFGSSAYGLISDRHIDPTPNNYFINIVTGSGLGISYNDPNYTYPGNGSDDGNFFEVSRDNIVPSINVFHHLAAVYRQVDSSNVQLTTYIDGQMVKAKTMPGNFANTFNSNPVTIGTTSTFGEYLDGIMDEVSIYHRALSASEVKSIFLANTNGKFDPVMFNVSPAQSLSEARVVVPGETTNLFFGNNTTWQQQTITFTATSTNTPLVFSGIEPGMLLDNFALTGGSNGGLDYQPEQDLSDIIGTSAYGNWQMEVLDNRTGATNPAPILQSWHLAFTFANTNYIPMGSLTFPILTNGIPSTNSTGIPPGGVVFYQVNVPLNADAATNLLLFADYPLNVWWSTNYPPTVGGSNDVLLISGTNGVATLTTNSTPRIIPGTTYYLGVQNTNTVITVSNYAVEVDFHFTAQGMPYAFTEPATLVTGPGAQLNGMATPNGFAATAWFEWGTNTLYGNTTPPVAVGNGYSVVYTTNQISGLITNVPYHFRLVVSNGLAMTYGFDQVLDQANVIPWGANYAGQLDVPTNANNLTAIAGAYDHSLAVTTNGLVAAWGDSTAGQTSVPAGVSNIVAVAGGQTFSVGLRSGGTLTAWGSDFYAGAGETNVPAGLSNVVLVSSGQFSTLALQNDGNVVAFGASLINPTNLPAGLTNVVSVAGGMFHNVAVKNDGTVVAWGDDSLGQTNVPAGLSNVVAIAAGNYHNLALKSNGTVVAWGYNNDGQTNVPAGLSNVVAVAAGHYHSLALKADGTVVGWGDNSAGQLSPPAGLTNVVAISAGDFHSLALTAQSLSSLTNPVVLTLTNGAPQTNSIVGGGITYYEVMVPTNADFATNSLFVVNTNQTLNLWFSTNVPPTVGAPNDSLLLAAVTNGTVVLSANTVPALVPGSTYYLGVQNTNSFTVAYGITVNFHYITSTNTGPQTNTVPISSIIATNGGFLLTWYAPSNDLFQVQFTTNLFPANWITFTNVIGYNPNFAASATNATFTFFDDGLQYPFGPTRFYRLILLGSPANTLTLPAQTNFTAAGSSLVTVTNTATDSNTNALLTYSLVNPPANASISTNGIITWTNASPAGLAARFNTTVTDNGVPSATATNMFTVFVTPLPSITNVVVTATNSILSWSAPTNDLFQVRSATNLVPPVVWTTFPGIITSTNGLFSFTDTNLPLVMKFYQLILLP